jgi:hypothetical protein
MSSLIVSVFCFSLMPFWNFVNFTSEIHSFKNGVPLDTCFCWKCIDWHLSWWLRVKAPKIALGTKRFHSLTWPSKNLRTFREKLCPALSPLDWTNWTVLLFIIPLKTLTKKHRYRQPVAFHSSCCPCFDTSLDWRDIERGKPSIASLSKHDPGNGSTWIPCSYTNEQYDSSVWQRLDRWEPHTHTCTRIHTIQISNVWRRTCCASTGERETITHTVRLE